MSNMNMSKSKSQQIAEMRSDINRLLYIIDKREQREAKRVELQQFQEEREWSIQALKEAEQEKRERDEAVNRNSYKEQLKKEYYDALDSYNEKQYNNIILLNTLLRSIEKKTRIAGRLLRTEERAKMFGKILRLEEKRQKLQKEYENEFYWYKEHLKQIYYDNLDKYTEKQYYEGQDEYMKECYGNGLNTHYRW